MEIDQQFFETYQKSYHLSDYQRFTEQLCLYDKPYYAHRDYRQVIDVLDDQLLSNLCEDVVPDIGIYGIDRVFGPMGDYANLELVGAVMAFAPLLDHQKTPIGQLNSENRRFTQTQRLSMACQAMTPVMLYEIHDYELRPLLPIARQYQLPLRFSNNLKDRFSGARKLLYRVYNWEMAIFILDVPYHWSIWIQILCIELSCESLSVYNGMQKIVLGGYIMLSFRNYLSSCMYVWFFTLLRRQSNVGLFIGMYQNKITYSPDVIEWERSFYDEMPENGYDEQNIVFQNTGKNKYLCLFQDLILNTFVLQMKKKIMFIWQIYIQIKYLKFRFQYVTNGRIWTTR